MANIDNIDDATTVRELEVNDTAYDIVGKGILDQNNRTTNLEWIGTKAEYEALGAYSDKCTYIITDDSADSQSDEVGAIAEEVNTLKGYDYVVDWQVPTSANSYTWYRKYKSGWVEQGGEYTGNAKTITPPVVMATNKYQVAIKKQSAPSYWASTHLTVGARTTTSFTVNTYGDGASMNVSWQVSGMAA